MAHYLLQLSYVAETWATLIRNPQNRADAVRGAIENLGGKIEQTWLAFGDDDVVLIIDMPSNIAAAAMKRRRFMFTAAPDTSRRVRSDSSSGPRLCRR